MTGPALKLTEEQVATLLAQHGSSQVVCDLIADRRTLRAALDEQVKENEQLCERNDHFINLCNMRLGKMHEFRVRAERAEAALASRPDTALVRELCEALEIFSKTSLEASDDQRLRTQLVTAGSGEYSYGDVRRARDILTRPDVIAARKGGGE